MRTTSLSSGGNPRACSNGPWYREDGKPRRGLRTWLLWRAYWARARWRWPPTTHPPLVSLRGVRRAKSWRRGRRANGGVRAAIASLAAHRGSYAAHITKVKAHTSEEQAERGLVTTEWLRLHNGTADEAAREATQQHPALLRKFIDVMAGRGKLYIRFLQELAKLYIRVARAVEHAYSTVAGATEAPPLPPSLAVGGWPGPRW